MKWYWVIFFSKTVPNPFVADSSDLRGFGEWDFMKGVTIENWNSEAWLKAEGPQNNGVPDDVLSNLHALPIFSGRLRKALEQARIGGIQYLPVRVFRTNGEEIPGFSIANILNFLPVLDLRKSEVEFFPNDYFLHQKRRQVRDVRRTVLQASVLEEFDIIRSAELRSDIYVSYRVKDLFEKAGFTGYSFEPVEVL